MSTPTTHSLLLAAVSLPQAEVEKKLLQFLLSHNMGGERPACSTPTDFLHCSQFTASTATLSRSEAQLKIWNVLVQSIQHLPKKLSNSTHQPPYVCASNVHATAIQTTTGLFRSRFPNEASGCFTRTIYWKSAFITFCKREKDNQTKRQTIFSLERRFLWGPLRFKNKCLVLSHFIKRKKEI